MYEVADNEARRSANELFLLVPRPFIPCVSRVRVFRLFFFKVEITFLRAGGGGHLGGASELQGVPNPSKIALFVTPHDLT